MSDVNSMNDEPWSDERYRIETPERVDLEYDVAGLGSRFLAALIDSTAIVAVAGLVATLGALALGFLFALVSKLTGVGSVDSAAVLGMAFAGLLAFVVIWGYYVLFEMIWHGQSPGKRVVGLRVIKDGGYPIGFLDSVIRNVVRLVDFLPGYYIVGIVVMFVDKRYRRLGDLAAGTIVIKERKDLKLDAIDVPSARQAGSGSSGDAGSIVPNPQLETVRLSADEQSLVREYFLRQPTLTPSAAADIARRLADALARNHQIDLGGDSPDDFLRRLLRSAK